MCSRYGLYQGGRNSNAESEKLNRIDIDGPSYPSRLGTAFERRSKIREQPVQCRPVTTLEKELRPVSSGFSFHRRADRAEHPDTLYARVFGPAPGKPQKYVGIVALRGRRAD